MKRVLIVLGTRPEAIKMAPIIRAIQNESDFECTICSTGQHREMLDQALSLFQIEPDIRLDAMTEDQSLSGLTSKLLGQVDSVIADKQPEWVLAQGDTTSVLVAAMTCFYRQRCFGHVEAGLRTGQLQQPFPEEMNRRVADLVASAHFAPTEEAVQTLISEGCAPDRVFLTGNTVVDALLEIVDMDYAWGEGPLKTIPKGKRVVLITAHRRESFGKPLEQICSALRDLSLRYAGDGVHFVYPVHLNPNVRSVVERRLSGLSNLTLMPPLDYASLVFLLKESVLVLTDSGGIQEEAPTLSTPVLVLRDVTERPEGVLAGVSKVIGTVRKSIVEEVSRLLDCETELQKMKSSINPYGDGNAAKRIVSAIRSMTPA